MKRIAFAVALSCLLMAPVQADEQGYHPDIGTFTRIVGGNFRYPFNFGPTGATGWFYDKEFVINGLDKGSPADGVLRMCDRIRAVNGRRFKGTVTDAGENDPRRVLGAGITESETPERGGKLVLTVWRDGKEVDLTVTLPVLGAYSETWPYNCEKSTKILRNACRWLADNQLPNGAFVEDRGDGFALGPALDGLLLLSSGDPEFLESARRLAHNFAENPGADPLKGDKTGTDMWGWSYEAMFMGEYYLRTGDTYVLPHLKHLYDIIMAAEHPRGSWSHGFKKSHYAVGGYINHTGIANVMALALMQEAGMQIDEKDFEKCKLYFRRYSYGGRGIHYGDHEPPAPAAGFFPCGTGKNGLATAAFEVIGEADTSARFALSVVDSYRIRDDSHCGPFLSLMWGPIGASRATPAEFRLFMDYSTWFHDLSRRWDGSFLLPSENGGKGYTCRGPMFTMGGQALVYALPLKKTRICGAKTSPFALITMPPQLEPIKTLVDRKQWAEAEERLAGMLEKGSLQGEVRARAGQMHESIQTTLKSVAFTLSQIERNIKNEEIVLARTRVKNLENLMGGTEGRLAILKKKAEDPEYDRIVAAWKTYQANRIASLADAGATGILKELAGDKKAGFVREKARLTLEANRAWPTYRDSFCAESTYRLYFPSWQANKQDPIPLAVLRALSFGDGILWTTSNTKKLVDNEGLLGEFPFSTPLLRTSEEEPVKWKYQTLAAFEPPQDWQNAEFDDSRWEEAEAPFMMPGKSDTEEEQAKKKFDKTFLVMRTAFEVKDTNVDALRVKCRIQDTADIYLNGRHIAHVLQGLGTKYTDFDISPAGLSALKKGRNVLAVRATRAGGFVDAGLLAVKR